MNELNEVRQAVVDIACMNGDPEMAHGAEDALYIRVLEIVASGHPDSAALAREALKVEAMSFPRWCA